MTESDLRRAQELFGVPEEFFDVAQQMVQEAEWELILRMGESDVSDAALRRLIETDRLAADSADFIRECYHRSIIDKVSDAPELTWHISSFYRRYPYYAQFEYYAYGKLPRETKEALNAWEFRVYLDTFAEDVRAKMRGENKWVHNSDFLTLQEAEDFVAKHEGHITLVPCNCKCEAYYHERPLNVCMELCDGPNSNADRGRGERLTLEQAKAKLREFNRKGLMQNGEEHFICNCDGQCCYPLNMARATGSQGVYPRSHYQIDWHEDECVNCGRCTQICNFSAFWKDEDKKVHYNPELCWGCTICAPNCPKNAIHLIPCPKPETLEEDCEKRVH